MGFTTDLGRFPAWKIQAFITLDAEFVRLQEEKDKRDRQKAKTQRK